MRSIHFLEPCYPPSGNLYELPGFDPPRVDEVYIKSLGVRVLPSEETLAALSFGSQCFARRLQAQTLLPKMQCHLATVDPDTVRDEIHNYTGHCPTLTYEINPMQGCGVGCQYCLVSDGIHEVPLTVFDNYPLYVRRLLDKHNGKGSANRNHYYYFSPKTEALQEATLQTGVAHRILREFIAHFRRVPESRARLFVASKAGARHLQTEDQGETILDLFEQLRERMQFNTSVSMMPQQLRALLEPYAAPIEERLAAVQLCQARGIRSDSALVQPIFTPFLSEERIRDFFTTLHQAGIRNYKPEFLTVCMENLAMLGPLLGRFDRDMERRLYEDYLLPSNAGHRKQRGRTAPDRATSRSWLRRMMSCSDTLGMSISLCYWVRGQLGVSEDMIPLVNRNGFQCLGYQTELFADV